jgi:hypothetical protein
MKYLLDDLYLVIPTKKVTNRMVQQFLMPTDNKIAWCLGCGKFTTNYRRGLCISCYKKQHPRQLHLGNCKVCNEFCVIEAREMCKACYSKFNYTNNPLQAYKRTSKYREKNRIKYITYTKNARRRRKILALQIVSKTEKPRCINCGCDDINILELNYIHGGHTRLYKEGKMDVGHNLHTAIVKGRVNPTLFDVRCSVCNMQHYLESKGIGGHQIIWVPKKADYEVQL